MINGSLPSSPADASSVDVLMTVFNGAPTVRDAINSIRCQTVAAGRIVVVDDGSTDGTGAILAELAREEPRLLVLSKPNSGITDSLRYGLPHCRAPFLARHDADDISHADRFAVQLDYLHAHPACVAVSGDARHIDADGRATGTVARMRPPAESDPDWIPAREPHLLQPFLMLRRDALLAVGSYRALMIAEDSDLYWRLQDVGELHNLSVTLGSYRIHPNSITSSSIRNGRINALCSQLSALSARRRRHGQADLRFDGKDSDSYSQATTLADFHAIGAVQLDAGERRRLRIAMAAKLIELCFYRPFEPDRQDCRFIRRALRDGDAFLSPENASILAGSLMSSAVRLASRGLVANALLLLPPALYPALLARLLFRFGIPLPLRTIVKRLLGRAQPARPATLRS